MDWGFGNPNKTAALIGTLMVGTWSLAYLRRWGFWLALIIFTALGACLIHTFSRGGIIALFVGLLAVVWKLPRPWPMMKVAAITLSIWVMIGLAVYFGMTKRIEQGVAMDDRSITNRLQIWTIAPQMMVDAPSGWGLGNSGHAYIEWYQPLDQSEDYRTLVNSHLTWLVEFGWPLRFLYLFGWGVAFLLCWPTERTGYLVIPLGIWTTFAVAAFFSSVAESGWLWIVPGLNLATALGYRVTRRNWFPSFAWLLPGGAAVVICAMLWLFGHGGTTINGSPNYVLIGEGKPSVWLVADENVLGHTYGKALRNYLNEAHPSAELLTVGVADSVANLPDVKGAMLIISGQLSEKDRQRLTQLAPYVSKIILICPAFYPQDLHLSANDMKRMDVVFGEFSQAFSATAWEKASHVRRIVGMGDFLPSWPKAVFVPNSSL